MPAFPLSAPVHTNKNKPTTHNPQPFAKTVRVFRMSVPPCTQLKIHNDQFPCTEQQGCRLTTPDDAIKTKTPPISSSLATAVTTAECHDGGKR
jgi:hypothetical protein